MPHTHCSDLLAETTSIRWPITQPHATLKEKGLELP